MNFNGCISASDKIVLLIHVNIYRVLEITFFTIINILVKAFTCQPKNVQEGFTNFF